MNYGPNYYQNPLIQPYGYQPMYQNQMQPNMGVQQQMQGVQKNEQLLRLQGKSVDSIDVVKAMDIPLDGSVSYFPLTDGSAIVSKFLQQDGTSKTIIYKPINEKEGENMPKYITSDELNEVIKKLDNTEFKEDMKNMKRKVKDIIEDIQDINNSINKRKE